MSKKQPKGIKPNMIDSPEMKALIKMHPSAKLEDITIPEHNKTGYSFVGLKVQKGAGASVKLKVQQFVKSESDWQQMPEDVKKRAFSQFDEVKMIHDPNKVEAPKPTEKELLVSEAKGLGLETKGLTIAQLKESIANKKADSDEVPTVD